MKVLICIPCLMTGGTEIQTLNLVSALVQGGHTVRTVCYFEHSNDMVKRYENAGSEVICLSKTGIRIHGWKSIIFLYKRLKQILKAFKPDVAHVQYMAPGALPIILLKILGVKQILATLHTFGDIYKNLWLIHFLQKYVLRAFTCITELAEKSFFETSQLYSESTALRRRNHFTIYNALPASFKVSNNNRVCDNTITIGVVSRLEFIKGMDLVIPAFKKILDQHGDTRLIVVGDGSLKEQMQQQAVQFECTSKVQWAGRQSQENLPGWYNQMDIVLIPSRSEGFGLTAIEAMECGCVVVASDIGGLPEVVKDKEVGLLHKPESIDDISEKVLSLMESHDKLKQYSDAAKKYVGKFSLDNYTRLFNDMYSKLDK